MRVATLLKVHLIRRHFHRLLAIAEAPESDAEDGEDAGPGVAPEASDEAAFAPDSQRLSPIVLDDAPSPAPSVHIIE